MLRPVRNFAVLTVFLSAAIAALLPSERNYPYENNPQLGRPLCYGIVPLTGEACGLSYRILCDVTARGKKTLEKALGVAQLGLQENWNHGSADDAHVGSIMLAPELLPFIGVFALLEAVVGRSGSPSPGKLSVSPPMTHRHAVDELKRYCGDEMVRRFAYAGTAGDRNQHMMTGRVV